MSDFAIKVENLSKCYRIGLKEQISDTLGGSIISWFKAPLSNLKNLRSLTRFEADFENSSDVIWALKDVSFEVMHGEVVGIIGANGAGKSTLLKIISRIVEPSAGRILLNGRVASLLEVGTGFHPELTGRENVYLNGTILGMSKAEVDRKFDEIVDFSGVEKFLDTPVKRYSSGMRVRLAFAVAAHLDPEILLIDEVLSVGDAGFQKKCLGKMDDVSQTGRTVLFVSHNMGAISHLCRRTILLQSGRLAAEGRTADIISLYQAPTGPETGSVSFDAASGEAYFSKASVLNAEQQIVADLHITAPFTIQLDYVLTSTLRNLDVAFILRDSNYNKIFTCSLSDVGHKYHDVHPAGAFSARVTVPSEFLTPGLYSITPVLHEFSRKLYDHRDSALHFRIMETGSVRYKMLGADTGAIMVRFNWNIRP